MDEPETVRTIYDIFRHWTLLGSWNPPSSEKWLEQQESTGTMSRPNVMDEEQQSTQGTNHDLTVQEQWDWMLEHLSPEGISEYLVGKVTVRKLFRNHGYFNGNIVQYNTETNLYSILFSDNEECSMSLPELRRYLPSHFRPLSFHVKSKTSEDGSGQKISAVPQALQGPALPVTSGATGGKDSQDSMLVDADESIPDGMEGRTTAQRVTRSWSKKREEEKEEEDKEGEEHRYDKDDEDGRPEEEEKDSYVEQEDEDASENESEDRINDESDSLSDSSVVSWHPGMECSL